MTTTTGPSQSDYGYTGEYTGDYDELLYLRARYYAPGMGRFLTRDTWSGNANLPMSYNRWQYVYSNPVNLTDPTGRYPAECLEASNFAQCLRDWMVEIHIPNSSNSILSLFDCESASISRQGGRSSQDGAPDTVEGGLGTKGNTLYKLYKEMWNMRGDTSAWWWQVYGNDRDGFTLVDFIATIYVRELANAQNLTDRKGKPINMNDYVEAMGRHAYSWCKDGSKFPKSFTCDSTTNRGLLYFIASWSQTARGIADGCSASCNLLSHFTYDYPQSATWALNIAKGIKNPLPSWRQFDKDALWDAGNPHEQVIKQNQIDDMHSIYQHNAHFESWDGKFFLTTYCETLFLHDAMGSFNGEGCVLSPSY